MKAKICRWLSEMCKADACSIICSVIFHFISLFFNFLVFVRH